MGYLKVWILGLALPSPGLSFLICATGGPLGRFLSTLHVSQSKAQAGTHPLPYEFSPDAAAPHAQTLLTSCLDLCVHVTLTV